MSDMARAGAPTAQSLLAGFLEELRLCRIGAGDEVVILSEPASDPSYVTAASEAARLLSAQVTGVVLQPDAKQPYGRRTGSGVGPSTIEEGSHLLSFLGASTLIVDLTTEGMVHAPWLKFLLGSGTRIIFVCEPAEVLLKNMPSEEGRRRAELARSRLAAAHIMRVTSQGGTSLIAEVDADRVGCQYGFADKPGRWDHWPSTMVTCYPKNVSGTIVLQEGDIIFPFKEYVREPVEITLERSVITSLEGGLEANLLRRSWLVESDPAARCASHFGWGLMETASWESLALYSKDDLMGMEARSMTGVFLWSTGPDPHLDRWTDAHFDIPMLNCTIELDGELVVEQGRLAS